VCGAQVQQSCAAATEDEISRRLFDKRWGKLLPDSRLAEVEFWGSILGMHGDPQSPVAALLR
jgi:hypothetical protein